MLQALSIRDMVLIEAAELRFRPGLNVLTGETGAGKSILLDCLGFVLGWRGRADLVRAGAAQGEVAAEFALAPGHPARAVLAEAGLPAADELILRRTVAADGRRQAWANDRRVAAETLRALADTLVELHGQQDDRGLIDPRGHRALLDAFAGAEDDLAADSRGAWAARAEAARALAEAREAAGGGGARRATTSRTPPPSSTGSTRSPDEEPALDARRRALRAAERIREDVARAAEALGPAGAEEPLLAAPCAGSRRAAPKADGALDAAVEGLGRALDELAEVGRARRGRARRSRRRSRASSSGSRSGSSPSARSPASTRSRPRRCRRWRRSSAPGSRALEDGAAEIGRLEAALAAREAAHGEAAARLSALRRGGGGAARRAHGAGARAAPARARGLRDRGRGGGARPGRASTGCASPSRPTPARPRARSTASPPAASCRASSWRSRSASARAAPA